jgi:hypothetical protein
MRIILLLATIVAAAILATTLPLSSATADAPLTARAAAETQDKIVTVTGTLDRWSILADGRVQFALRPRDPEAGKTMVWFRTPGSRDGEARFAQLVLSVFVEASGSKDALILTAHGEEDLREDGDARDEALTLERLDHVVRTSLPPLRPKASK